jgi:hypothetical protein
MSDYDDCDILELEISDDDETFREPHNDPEQVTPPEKRRRILEEPIQDSTSDDRIVVLLPPTSQQPKEVPSITASTSTAIPFLEFVQSSYSSVTRANIYRSRIPLIYPGIPIQDSRPTTFVPVICDSEDDNDDEVDTEYIDTGIHSLLNDEDQYGRSTRVWPPKHPFGPTPIQSFVNIQWNDKLGREFAENDIPNHNPTMMVEILKPEALHLISSAGPFFVDANSSGPFKVHQIKSQDQIDPEVLRGFLLPVHAWRILCFDTESDGKFLPYNVEPNKGKPGRIPVVFGNPEGTVLIFHDARKVPLELVRICADFRYVKFQSGIENDLAHLAKNGFRVFRGVVDVQTLITLVRPARNSSGIEFCTQYVWGDDSEEEPKDKVEPTACLPDNKNKEKKKEEPIRIKWTRFFNRDYLKENMTGLALKHSLQDVLTPFAILIKIGLEIANLRKMTEDPSENIFLTMNEALELCMSKAPADIRNKGHGFLARVIGENKLTNWMNDSAVDYCTPFQFNSHRLLHRIRCARSDLIEYHYTGLSWDEIQTLALNHIDILKGRLPFSNELKFIDLRFHIMDHCSHCGSLDHKSAACIEPTIPCYYEHGPDVDLPTHSIICCPALHAYCRLCFIRGHFTESHGKGWKSAAQLRRQFLENAPRGLFTSLPYLIRTDLTSANLLPHHFRLGLSGRRLVQSYGDYWMYGGLGRISEEEKEKGKRYRETSRRNLMSTPTTYKPLIFTPEVNANEQKAKEILIERGVITDAKKRLSGSQRRKRRRLTLELDAKDAAAAKDVRSCLD